MEKPVKKPVKKQISIGDVGKSVRNKTTHLEGRLLEWFLDGEVKYLQEWCFEYADREAKLHGIKSTEEKYTYLQILRRSEIITALYRGVSRSIANAKGEIMGIGINLPKYEDIDLILKEKYSK